MTEKKTARRISAGPPHSSEGVEAALGSHRYVYDIILAAAHDGCRAVVEIARSYFRQAEITPTGERVLRPLKWFVSSSKRAAIQALQQAQQPNPAADPRAAGA